MRNLSHFLLVPFNIYLTFRCHERSSNIGKMRMEVEEGGKKEEEEEEGTTTTTRIGENSEHSRLTSQISR